MIATMSDAPKRALGVNGTIRCIAALASAPRIKICE
jgi:hypothetical protein